MRRHCLLGALACLVLPVAAAAQETAAPGRAAEDGQACTGQTTIAIVECKVALTQEWDDRLNAAYRTLVTDLPEDRAAALRDVQRAWIAWRDGNCRWYAGGEGSIARIEAAQCLHDLTRARAQELETMTGQ